MKVNFLEISLESKNPIVLKKTEGFLITKNYSLEYLIYTGIIEPSTYNQRVSFYIKGNDLNSIKTYEGYKLTTFKLN